jgi:hypothetical protein
MDIHGNVRVWGVMKKALKQLPEYHTTQSGVSYDSVGVLTLKVQESPFSTFKVEKQQFHAQGLDSRNFTPRGLTTRAHVTNVTAVSDSPTRTEDKS